MLLESERTIVQAKRRLAESLLVSQRDRERVLEVYLRRVRQSPQRADVALVMGTSPLKYPQKFETRVRTAVELLTNGKVSMIIFSGAGDHETEDTDQAGEALKLAFSKYGLDPSKALTVGGYNTAENLQKAREAIIARGDLVDIFLVSESHHLIRAVPLADHLFRNDGLRVHPRPVDGESWLDPSDPDVILEIIKTLCYNRTVMRSRRPISGEMHAAIDDLVAESIQLIDEFSLRNIPPSLSVSSTKIAPELSTSSL